MNVGIEYQKLSAGYAAIATKSESDRARGAQRQYGIFERIQYPKYDETRDPAVWAGLVEPVLPPNLRQHHDSHTDLTLDAKDVAEILLAAQRLVDSKRGADILYHLGIVQGRWSAVVWIVKRLVEAFGERYVRAEQTQLLSSWASDESLDEITQSAIDFQRLTDSANKSAIPPSSTRTLEDLTQDVTLSFSRHETLRRDALGQIWRSLGNMTIACAGDDIKPEILEIIAYLHHMGIMPVSIYNQTLSADVTTIQQPPTLNLFSSQILTSLSDAAWRAHERLVVEESKAAGGEYASLKPEIPDAVYRVGVSGLKPEIWLELILWSCLHGGWVLEGGEILRTMYNERKPRRWRPLSWRSLVPDGGSGDHDWDKLEFSFKTRAPSAKDQPAVPSKVTVERTISSEVINAYVDAALSTMRMGVGDRGTAPGYILEQLTTLQKFLARSRLSLSTGSWDAIVLRFFDSQQHIVDQRRHFDLLISLSRAMGEELDLTSRPNLPAYVLDGSAAVFGLFHRALLSKIKARDFEGALQLFDALQQRADSNKYKSIVDFLQKQRRFGRAKLGSESDLFTSNIPGIDFPAFDIHIPPTILGPFLDLITDYKAYEFGKWLLYSSDLDGPVIPERLYVDPAIAPVLVRFAAETGDTPLLSKMIRTYTEKASGDGPQLPRNVLQSFFDSQINLKRWDAATRILQHMKDRPYSYWNLVNLAQVVRIMLLESQSPGSEDPNSHFSRTKTLFAEMVSGEYDREGLRNDSFHDQVAILVTMLSVADSYWAKFCSTFYPLKGHCRFDLPLKAFNLILEGVVSAYGSTPGRRLLGIFWSHAVRDAQKSGQRLSGAAAGEPMMSKYEPLSQDQPSQQRRVIHVFAEPKQSMVMYGGLQPDLMTIRYIFRQALEDLKTSTTATSSPTNASPEDSSQPVSLVDASASLVDTSLGSDELGGEGVDLTASGIVVWAVQCLRSLRMADEDIISELRTALVEDQLEEIRAKLPNLFQQEDGGWDSNASITQEEQDRSDEL